MKSRIFSCRFATLKNVMNVLTGLKIRNFLSAGSFQNCVSSQENQLGPKGALLDPLGVLGAQSLKMFDSEFLKPCKSHFLATQSRFTLYRQT